MCVRELIARNWLQSIGRYSDMYSNTRIMQTAFPVLHNALCLSGLSHANELEMMEPSQVDGNLPLAWPWNTGDSSNIIDAAKVQKRDRWGAKSQDGGWGRVIPEGSAGNNAAFCCLSSAALLHKDWRTGRPSFMSSFVQRSKRSPLFGKIWLLV